MNRRLGWALLSVLLGLGAAWVLLDAVTDLVAEPSFPAVLRLVIEAIAAAVVIGAAAMRARREPDR